MVPARHSRPSGDRALRCVLFVAAALLHLASPAGAAEGEPAPPQAQSVQLTLRASPAAGATVERLLRDALARRGMRLETSVTTSLDLQAFASSTAGDATISLLMDLASSPKMLYVANRRLGLIHTRELAVKEEPDTVELELIRLVVESAFDTLAAEQAKAVARAEDRSANTPVPAGAEPSPQATLAAGYQGQRVGEGILGHGILLAGGWRPFWLRFDGSLRVQWPIHVQLPATAASLGLWSTSLRLHAVLPVALAARTYLLVGLGAGWEVTRVAPRGAQAVSPFWASSLTGSAFTALERSWGRFLLVLRFDVEADPTGVRYETLRATGAATVWRPSRLRGGLALLAGTAF